MGVVEQQPEPAASGPPASDLGHQLRVAPLVDDDQVRLCASGLGDGRRIAIARGVELGIGLAPGLEPRLAVIAQEVLQAPRVLGLIDGHLVASAHELAQHAPLEVGVAVVPAGRQGVGEVADPHAAASVMGSRPASTPR